MSRCAIDGCLNVANNSCGGCLTLEIPKRLCVCYCGKECQSAHWPIHKKFHHMLKKGKLTDDRGYSGTVVLTLLELKAINRLPVLAEGGNFSIMFAGARDECMMDFADLRNLIQELVYPELNILSVCLCGKQVDSGPLGRFNSTQNLLVECIPKFVEEAFPTSTDLEVFDIIYIIAPGLTDFCVGWDPAIQLMQASNTPIVVTSYSNLTSHNRKMDNDALFDEDCMRNFFRSNVLLPTTFNPSYDLDCRGALGHKNCYYSIYQGIDTSLPAIPRLEYMKKMTAEYLKFQADFYGEDNPFFAKQCIKLGKRLMNGTMAYHEQKMSYFVRLANENF